VGGPFISHIGIAVADLDAAVSRWEKLLGCPPSLVTEVADQSVRVAMFAPPGARDGACRRIELIAATAPDSPVGRFVEKRGEGLHHLCLYVDDIESKLSELKAAGVPLIDETPRVGAEGRRVAFVHPRGTHGVLIEYEERPA